MKTCIIFGSFQSVLIKGVCSCDSFACPGHCDIKTHQLVASCRDMQCASRWEHSLEKSGCMLWMIWHWGIWVSSDLFLGDWSNTKWILCACFHCIKSETANSGKIRKQVTGSGWCTIQGSYSNIKWLSPGQNMQLVTKSGLPTKRQESGKCNCLFLKRDPKAA